MYVVIDKGKVLFNNVSCSAYCWRDIDMITIVTVQNKVLGLLSSKYTNDSNYYYSIMSIEVFLIQQRHWHTMLTMRSSQYHYALPSTSTAINSIHLNVNVQSQLITIN